MIFEVHKPKPPLDRFVEAFIYFEQYQTDYLIERFLPDGNVELVISLGDQPQHIYDNETLRPVQACRNAWTSGVRTAPISIPAGNEAQMFVVVFKKGMARPFFPLPMEEIRDTVVDASKIWGPEIDFLREQLIETPKPAGKFRLAEEFFVKGLGKSMANPDFIEYGVTKIVSDPTGVSLESLVAEVGYSQRHFIQKFKDGVGLSPKRYMRVLRFQKAITELERPGFDWAEISLDCGYYDQSHFIRDFRHFSGFTPSDYIERKNGNLNYVPVA